MNQSERSNSIIIRALKFTPKFILSMMEQNNAKDPAGEANKVVMNTSDFPREPSKIPLSRRSFLCPKTQEEKSRLMVAKKELQNRMTHQSAQQRAIDECLERQNISPWWR